MCEVSLPHTLRVFASVGSHRITQIGKHAVEDTAGHAAVPAFTETARDFKSFERRAGALPEQQVRFRESFVRESMS